MKSDEYVSSVTNYWVSKVVGHAALFLFSLIATVSFHLSILGLTGVILLVVVIAMAHFIEGRAKGEMEKEV